MSWATPHTYATGDIVTAANMNETRDNLIDLDRRTTITGATVATAETTTSATYVNLATSGPAVTVTIGATGKALVAISSHWTNSGANASLMSYAVSGATTVAAADSQDMGGTPVSAGTSNAAGITLLVSGLNAGSTTFTAKYRVTAGTGTWDTRNILVTPLGS